MRKSTQKTEKKYNVNDNNIDIKKLSNKRWKKDGFVINQENLVIPTQVIEFLGMEIDSKTNVYSIPQEKVCKIKSKCQILYHSHHVAILEFTKVQDHLASIILGPSQPAYIYFPFSSNKFRLWMSRGHTKAI